MKNLFAALMAMLFVCLFVPVTHADDTGSLVKTELVINPGVNHIQTISVHSIKTLFEADQVPKLYLCTHSIKNLYNSDSYYTDYDKISTFTGDNYNWQALHSERRFNLYKNKVPVLYIYKYRINYTPPLHI